MSIRSIAISIDFDFFVPEEADFDMQHCESLFYLNMIWELRGAFLYNALRCTEEVKTFWRKLGPLSRYYKAPVTVSDAHCFAMRDPRIVAADTIILFDRHHDCWPVTRDEKREKNFGSHNWARAWLSSDRERQLIWVYPDTNDPADYRDSCADLRKSKRIRALPRKEFDPEEFAMDDLLGVHVCRSGCWTPPWTDTDFIRFVQRLHCPIEVLQRDEEWHPMKPRWDNVEERIAVMRQREAALKHANGTQCVGGDPLVPLTNGG